MQFASVESKKYILSYCGTVETRIQTFTIASYETTRHYHCFEWVSPLSLAGSRDSSMLVRMRVDANERGNTTKVIQEQQV